MQTSSQDRHQMTCSSGPLIFHRDPAYSFFDANTTHLSFATTTNNNNSSSSYNNVFTLESTPALPPPTTKQLLVLSPQSYISNPSPDTPTSCFSTTEDNNNNNHSLLTHKLKELESLLYQEDDNTPHINHYHQPTTTRMLPPAGLHLKDVLARCAAAFPDNNDNFSDNDKRTASALMDVLANMVSVSGNPIQRLGAYFLEGLRARAQKSGTLIYKSLNCEQPTSAQLLSYMHVLYQICPFWKFAYTSANVVISQAMQNESRIHIIDFQIAQGTQWASLIQDLALRPGGPPHICITGVDDSQSTHARGGGLHIVGEKLSQLAKSCNVPFEFHDAAAMLDDEVKLENLRIKAGEAIAVSFPFILHHVPDESVTTHNHRDQLLRVIKRMSPKVVTLVEQESNTNTSAFLPRFMEALDYYTAMFEAIDVARPRDDKQRMKAEQQCVARDIVNMIACEGEERVERHEPVRKWIARFKMAGFTQCRLSPLVTEAVREMLKEYNESYGVAERDGALYLGWKKRAMSTCSAWM